MRLLNEICEVRQIGTTGGLIPARNLTNAPPSKTAKTGGVLSPIGIPTNAPPTANNTSTPSTVKPTNPSNSTGSTPLPPPFQDAVLVLTIQHAIRQHLIHNQHKQGAM
jgi:hypothetical protein